MKVVVVLCAVLPFTGRPLLTGPWLLNSKFTQHSLQGTRQKWTGLSHHAQLSMCTSRDKMAASGMEFSVLIECEFVAVVSWKVGWLCFFNTKFALVRSDDWWVSFTRPWAVFTRLGRPDEWLVRTLTTATKPSTAQLYSIFYGLYCTQANHYKGQYSFPSISQLL